MFNIVYLKLSPRDKRCEDSIHDDINKTVCEVLTKCNCVNIAKGKPQGVRMLK